MTDGDHTHGTNARFHDTHWSVVLAAGKGAVGALERLCAAYWYPLYAFARRQGQKPPDAQDLTQQFFAGFLAKKSFSLADPDRGRFRSFLLASFKHFLTNEYHRSQAVKRGGQANVISWDAEQTEERYRHEPATDASPDKIFERTWVLTLLGKVLNDLREEYVRAGKKPLFDALHVFLVLSKIESQVSGFRQLDAVALEKLRAVIRRAAAFEQGTKPTAP